MAPKRDADHAFDINRLNMFFAVCSILLFVFFVWMLWEDFGRQWKKFQVEFRKIERTKTEVAIQQEVEELKNNPEYQQILQEMKTAQQALKQNEDDYQKILDEKRDLDGSFYNADQKYRFKKAEYESKRYDYEEALIEHPNKAGDMKKELEKTEQEMTKLLADLDKITARRTELDEKAAQFTKKIEELEKERTKLRTKLDRFERKEESLRTNVANIFRNLPLVDFIDPSIEIKQVVVDNLYEDLNFTAVPRVDRCMTCHVAIDQEGYEEGTEIPGYGKIKQPYASHPRLDLYVASTSKHPMETFGCTGCHMGRGRSTSFIGSVHIPEDEKEEKRWEEEYDWHRFHHWDFPMYRSSQVQASCIKCHGAEANIGEADQMNLARTLFIENGCHGCHLTKGFENLPKVGPDLRRVANKVSKEWAFKWIQNPKAFRPTTRMPRYFHNSNNSSPGDLDRGYVETRAMVEYLFAKSSPVDLQPSSSTGNAATGRQLVMEIGCVGCHLVEGEKPSKVDTRRRFGPPLDKLGSKTNDAWLYTWVKNPSHYSPDTRMPSMKLTDQEAADITAYLLTLRDPQWEGQPIPQLKEQYLKEEVLHYLRRTHGLGAETEYNKMSDQERLVFLGERTISRYGCSGCHLIEGFENAKGIGTSLSEEGSKRVTKFDFGFVEIEHSVPAWISTKLHDPRIFDKGKEKRWDEKLMMPNFSFNDDEVNALTMLVVGLTKERVPVEAQRRLSDREQIAERGRWLARERNCIACHNIDGWGGEIREVIKEPGMAPPVLFRQGEKVQSDWLFSFLKAPGKIRPWLKVRMPNFQLTDEETNTLVQFFMAADNVGPFNSTPNIKQHVAEGENLFRTFQCSLCHVVGGVVPEGRQSSELAPDLTMARTRLRPDWVIKWLYDPQKLQPGTRMPDYFPEAAIPTVLEGNADIQVQAIRNYIFSIGRGNQASIAETPEMVPAEQPPAQQEETQQSTPAGN